MPGRADPSRPAAGLAARLDERWNPVLVREVRQALRGKLFRLAFLAVLTGGIGAALFTIIDGGPQGTERISRDIFEAATFCLFLTCLVQVPMAAFSSMSSEWEEDTFDLLALSNLRPRQIVLGKLAAAGLQTLLHFSALAPLVVCCFLLRGVGLLQIALLLGGTLVLSLGYAAVGIALASMARPRALRTALLALFVAATVLAAFGLYEGFNFGRFLSGGRSMSLKDMLQMSSFLLALALGGGSIALALASARLAHPEENRSSAPRLAVTLSVGGLLAWLVTMLYTEGWEFEPVTWGIMVIMTLLAIFAALFSSEPESLGRRVRLLVPSNRGRAFLMLPMLPGGARGFIWLCAGLVLCIALYLALFLTHLGAMGTDLTSVIDASWRIPLELVGARWEPGYLPASFSGGVLTGAMASLRDHPETGPVQVFVWAAWLVLCVGLPTAFCAGRTRRLAWRATAAIAPLGLCALLVLGPTLLGFLIDNHGWRKAEHIGNPIWVIGEIWNGHMDGVWCSGPILAAGLLALLVNLPRCTRAWRELSEASAARRARDAALAQRQAAQQESHALAQA